MHTYKYHIVYKTTNLLNGKFYIELHSSNTLNDKYKGSGWILKNAFKKYGKKNFKRENLFVFNNRDEAREMEYMILSGGFLKRKDLYNIMEGGLGVENQWGENNHMYGKVAPNAVKVIAKHLDGRTLEFTSIQACADAIGIDRGNVRNLIKKGIRGRRGWSIVKI
jgi:hypothetical protein